MSDHLLRLIPEQPDFEPTVPAVDAALNALTGFVRAEAVTADRYGRVVFVDQGSNFECVRCPYCQKDVSEQWGKWMSASSQTGFLKRTITLPCCIRPIDLNDLMYEWPAGFAKFQLEARNPDPSGWLPGLSQLRLEQILGCKLRQVLTRY